MEDRSLNSAENQMRQMVGIDKIIAQLEHFQTIYKVSLEQGGNEFTPQLAFLGNPGTGKTSVARLFAKILHEDGILSKGHIVETSPGQLISQYVGGTRAQALAVYKTAKGGVLFIDEAYGLNNGYGAEAIDALLEFMTDVENRDTVVILAGYADPMRDFFNSHLGLKMRFTEVYFEDYSNEELWEILKLKVNNKEGQCLMDEAACEQAAISYYAAQPRDRTFGNARIVDTLLSVLIGNRDKRYCEATAEQKKDASFARTILPVDFPVAQKNLTEEKLPPMERLNAMRGIDKVRMQFERYCNAYHAYLKGEGGGRFRPHMVFIGPPNTGKEVVAHLFGEILHEEGLLPKNKFIARTVEDLVGKYVGETRSKTQAVCENRAKGGVLFIDEAHKLMSGAGLHEYLNFGAEAIDMLIQFMEKNDDSLVILAGSTKEIYNLLDNGNPKLRRCFNELGFFEFEDYEPEVLLDILLELLGIIMPPTSDKFNEDMLKLIRYKCEHRIDKDWINADTMTAYAAEIYSNVHSGKHGKRNVTVLDSDCIPEHLMKIIEKVKNEEDLRQMDILNKSVMDLQEVLENIQFNVSNLVKNQASMADVAVMRRENEAFRNDSNMKLMRRYGIDAMIKTYQAICDRIFRLKHTHLENQTDDIEISTLNWVLKRIERQFKSLGIKLKSSQPGTNIDESVMEVYGSDGEDVEDSEAIIETDDMNLKDTVKESVCPAFVWTIPSLIGDGKEWYMEVEKVCIYK